MTSPYINTKIQTSVILHPHQMDNKIYINLKKNLESKVVGRCFLKYGFIMKIINIVSYEDGVIEAENVESSALFDLEFSCRLCAPLKNTTIICEIDRINKLLVTAKNGPILIVITNDRLNSAVFFKDNNNNIRYKKNGQSKMLEPQDFIKVKLQTIRFYDGDTKIKAIGFIEDMASEEEKKSYYSDQYSNQSQIVDFETYMKNVEEENNQVVEEQI
jgi:DNA-directed RNA polymerase subunit E'/Rpb7